MADYNGDVIDMEGNDLLISHVESKDKGGKYNVRLFKLKSKNDKSREYEINDSMSSEAFLKGYLHNSSDLVMLSDDTFSLYDSEKKKKNTLTNLNDCEPSDFVYFKKNIIFIQKNKCSLFQARTNGKCSTMLNLKEPPVKVNFCSHMKNIIYLSTKSRVYFLKLLHLKDKTLKLRNTNMSLPTKYRQEEHVYHSHRNENPQGKNEYKEVIHVCSYSCKDVTVYKFVKGQVKNKKKCFTKLDIRMLNDESIKGVFFFKVKHSSRGCNNGEESAREGGHLSTSNASGDENVNHVSHANEGENSHDVADSKEVSEREDQNGEVEVAHEGQTSSTSPTKEDVIKLYLLIYSNSGKVLIYLIDYLNLPHFKFGLAHVSKCPLAQMELPFKVAQIYDASDNLLKRVMKQKNILKKKKENSPNFSKYLHHMDNKYAYINSNFFMDTIFISEKSAVIYTIQIRHDFLTIPEEGEEVVLLKVMNANEKIVAIKDVEDSEVKKNLVHKILNESKFSCYSDSDSYIDSDITWNDDSDKTDSCDEDKSDYSECDVTADQGHVNNSTGDDTVKQDLPLPGGKIQLVQMACNEPSKNAAKSCAHNDQDIDVQDDVHDDVRDDASAPEEEPSNASSHETDHLKQGEKGAARETHQGIDEFEVTTNVSRNDGSVSNSTREKNGTHASCSSTPSLGGSDTVLGRVDEEEQTDELGEANLTDQKGEERKKRKLKKEESAPGVDIPEGNFLQRENVKKSKVGDSSLDELTCEVTGQVADDVPRRNKMNITEDCFNDMESPSEGETKNNNSENVVTPSDKFLALSSMIKLNISLGRYHIVSMLVKVKDKKLIKDTVSNLGKKYSIKLLEVLLNSLARSRFFLGTFFFWIKAICKEHKETLKGKKYRKLVTKISLLAENNLKNEGIIKHVINKIDFTIDHIRKNLISDNDQILNYQDGTIMK
ncbi:Uncharacterized protein PCOAH_00027050 [Plasmodium coatneyi]|uniref:Uncharacterized protein n=1 Tax=Plasmodium coatneyi TaxID=208452 RepID=A0A1B1DYZ9_9APIC|nr:Uncharacterized protein PCOAH_00027050 [Plasmodium coatneyi]ANQ08031.1 Uncharacterized protein PCOAH_00027050 [Plasmodium coatneyi]